MDRLETFLAAARDDVPLRTLTLHMLEHLAPGLFRERRLAELQRAALEACRQVPCEFRNAQGLQAGVDAWYCRHLKGLPHPAPDPSALRAALQWLADDDQLIYAWLIGEQAARCGVDVRLQVEERPFRESSRVHDAYWLTHLVMLETDYFARPSLDSARDERELNELVPWLLANPLPDLAGEVAFCLRFLGHDAGALISQLERAAPTEDPHEQATALLALSAE